MNDIKQILKERILLLDGAMGTMIQRYKPDEATYRGVRFKDFPNELKGNNDLLSLTQPRMIKEIHSEYLKAGADIIETNTFSSNSIAQADYKLENLAKELNYESARLAKECAEEFTKMKPEKPRFVAGAIGPTNQTLSISPDVNNPGFRKTDFDAMTESYYTQVEGLVEGGVDIILI